MCRGETNEDRQANAERVGYQGTEASTFRLAKSELVENDEISAASLKPCGCQPHGVLKCACIHSAGGRPGTQILRNPGHGTIGK